MKVYQTSEIRNIALLGNSRSGKTTLAESMLFHGGVISRRGSIEDKNTVSDYREMVFYYNLCLEKYKSLKTNIKNYETAVRYVSGLKGKTNDNRIAQEYLKFMVNFDQQVFDYQQYMIAHII